jgi:hypothetical protein
LSGALSNFGALNCVASLEPVAHQLASQIPSARFVVLCVMGRFCWRETVRYLLRFDFSRATRRWWGSTMWRGKAIRYWSSRDIRKAFSGHFTLERRIAIGRGDHQLYVLRRRQEC